MAEVHRSVDAEVLDEGTRRDDTEDAVVVVGRCGVEARNLVTLSVEVALVASIAIGGRGPVANGCPAVHRNQVGHIDVGRQHSVGIHFLTAVHQVGQRGKVVGSANLVVLCAIDKGTVQVLSPNIQSQHTAKRCQEKRVEVLSHNLLVF